MARHIMEAISKATSMQMDENSSIGNLKEGEWRMSLNAEGTWNANTQVQAKSTEAIQEIMKKIHGIAIEADGMSHTIEVSSDFVKNTHCRGA